METTHIPTEQSSGKLTTWQPQQPQSALLGWIVEQVMILAEAIGEAMTPARLQIYAAELADLDREQLTIAFKRARRECKFFPKIPELREMAGAVTSHDAEDAEARNAWDEAIRFAKYHVRSGPEGDGLEVDECNLAPRILDAVRRCGGWRPFALSTRQPDPFLKKEFLAEFQAAPAIDRMTTNLLPEGRRCASRFTQLLEAMKDRDFQ